jgi:hypothetical protein
MRGTARRGVRTLARLGVALVLALLLLIAGVTIELGGPRDRIDIFFELRSEVPGLTFLVEGIEAPPPLLLTVHDADPALLEAPFPGTTAPLAPSEVDIDAFVADRFSLIHELVPGLREGEVLSWQGGGTEVGAARVLWFTDLFRVRGAPREDGSDRADLLLLGIGIDDPPLEDPPGGRRFPEFFQIGRASVVEVRGAPDGRPLIARTRVDLRLSGPAERPETARVRIVTTLAPRSEEPTRSEGGSTGADLPERPGGG